MVTIRAAKLEEAGKLARILVDTRKVVNHGLVPPDFLESLSYGVKETLYRERLAGPETSHITLVAQGGTGELRGFISALPLSSTNLEIRELYLNLDFQRQGIGGALVKRLFQLALGQGYQECSVSVLAGNTYREFYDAIGAKFKTFAAREIGGQSCPMAVYYFSEAQMKKIAGLS